MFVVWCGGGSAGSVARRLEGRIDSPEGIEVDPAGTKAIIRSSGSTILPHLFFEGHDSRLRLRFGPLNRSDGSVDDVLLLLLLRRRRQLRLRRGSRRRKALLLLLILLLLILLLR